MNDDDLRHKLAASDLTRPGITLDEALKRAAGRVPARRPTGALRLAMAALVVWAAVFVAQAAVEHNLNGLVPPNRTAIAQETAPSLLVEQRLLLAELLGEGGRAPAVVQQGEGETPPVRQDSTDHTRRGAVPMRRWTHV
ncbi:MAG: hypothetical protein FJX75_23660 [Armatimonadetes bacterium]|nr:hypothetical protein [Armatimonadota bacterium]